MAPDVSGIWYVSSSSVTTRVGVLPPPPYPGGGVGCAGLGRTDPREGRRPAKGLVGVHGKQASC